MFAYIDIEILDPYMTTYEECTVYNLKFEENQSTTAVVICAIHFYKTRMRDRQTDRQVTFVRFKHSYIQKNIKSLREI